MIRHFLSSITIVSMIVVSAVANAHDKEADSARYAKLEKLLTNTKLVGKFTILGKQDGDLKKEEYTISSAKKSEKGDWWTITARIKYGKYDVKLPIPLEIKWAGDTPVITMTDAGIPGLGTFSARVLFDDDKYAGTWKHGAVSGHLFGTLEKIEP